MEAWRYARLSRKPEKKVFGVLIHFLLNLRGVDESKWFAKMAKARKKLESSKRGRDMVDHGWEIVALKKAGLWK